MFLEISPILTKNILRPQNLHAVQNLQIGEVLIPSRDSPVSIPMNLSSKSKIQRGFYLPLNFKGSDSYSLTKDLKNLENIHCPICGIKMLSKNEMEKIVEEGSKINDPKEFANWIKSREDSIPVMFKKFSASAQRASSLSSIRDMDSLFAFMREDALLNSQNALEKTQKMISQKQEEYCFSDSDNVLLDECKIRLDTLGRFGIFDENKKEDLYKSVKNILNETINPLESNQKQTLYFLLRKDIEEPSLYQDLFAESKNRHKTAPQKQILSNLFENSGSNVHKIVTNFDVDHDIKSNLILNCKSCEAPSSSHIFLYHKNRPDLKKNFLKYLEDIGSNILEGKLEGHTYYPSGLQKFVNKLTNSRLESKRFDSPVLNAVRIKHFEQKRALLDFEPLKHSGIPCCSCGHITLTHKEKLEYFEQIQNTKNLHELSDFLQKNKELFIKRNRDIIFIFQKILKNNPNYNELQMLDSLKKSCANDMKRQLEKNIKFSESLLPKLSIENQKLLQNYIDGLNQRFCNFPYKYPFKYEEYTELLKETIFQIKDENFNNRIATNFKESIRRRYHSQLNFFPQKETIEKVGSVMKVVFQDLLNDSVATKDHLKASKRNGQDISANLSVMCRNCNSEKTDYSLLHWYNLHPEIAQNMQKYISKIVSMINSGELKDMDSYPAMFAKSVNILTQGRVVLRFDLKNKKTKA